MFFQRCITPDCRAEYPINERLYVCSRCGGLLDVERARQIAIDPTSLRNLWRQRLSSLDTRDRSEWVNSQGGIGLCNITKCCTEVCPEHIHITDNGIIPLKERVADDMDPIVSLLRKFRGQKTS